MRGAATVSKCAKNQRNRFLLTRLMRGAAAVAAGSAAVVVFLLTRLMRGAAATQ